jgi:hypothetical protein
MLRAINDVVEYVKLGRQFTKISALYDDSKPALPGEPPFGQEGSA